MTKSHTMTKSQMNKSIKSLQRAINIAGGQSALARELTKVTRRAKPYRQSTVYSWLSGQCPVPVTLVAEIEDITGVYCSDLRPDLAHLFDRDSWPR